MSRPSRLQRLHLELTGHLRTKLVMMLLAGLCWFFVRTERETEVEFTFPLQVDLTELPGMVVLSSPPREVQVRMRGKGRSLLLFALFHKGRYVLRPDPDGGAHAVSAKHLDVEGAEDLAVQSTFPSLIQVQLDELDTKTLPVRFRGAVEAAAGYRLTAGPSVEPASVTAMGARSLLDTLEWVATEWADLSNRKRDVEEQLALRRPWPGLNLARPAVTVRAAIEREAERRFAGIPLEILGLPDSLRVAPGSFALTVTGGERMLETLTPGQIHAVLDLEELEPGATRAPCRVIVPPGFSWKDPLPERFTIAPRRLAPLDSLALDSLARTGLPAGWLRRP